MTKTPLHKWNNKQLLFDSDGKALPSEKTDRLSTLLWEVIEEAFSFSDTERQKNGGKDIPVSDSLYDFVTRRAKEVLEDEEEQKLLIQMSEMWGAYVGEPIWRQSLRFAWMEECCGGGEHPLAKVGKAGVLTERRGDVCCVRLLGHLWAHRKGGP